MVAFATRAVSLFAILALALISYQTGAAARSAPGAMAASPKAAPKPASHGYMTRVQVRGQPPVALYAEEYGRGRPILLLHGLGASSYSWRHVIPKLARNNRVIAVDLKGFGKSEKPFDLAYSPFDHANLIAAFIRKRGLKDFTLVGHSYGGAIALLVTLDFNRREKGRIRDLVLMNAPAYNQPSTAFVSFMRTPVLPYAILTLVPPELSAWLSLNPNEQENLTYEDVRSYARPYYDAAARHALISTSRQIVPREVDRLTARYPTIKQRTLVIWCDRDETVPIETGIRLTKALPNARMKVISGCSHAPQDERPAAVVDLFKSFLRRS